MSTLHTAITIRPAAADDAPALTRLAVLDSAAVPETPVLVAEVGGELWAAVSLWDGRAVADPFHHTADLVALLRDHVVRARARRAPASVPPLTAVRAVAQALRRLRGTHPDPRWRAA